MDIGEEQILDKITAHISSYISEWFGEGAVLSRLPQRWNVLRESFFLRYTVRLPDDSVVLRVKIARRATIPTLGEAIRNQRLRNLTRQEYETLTAISGVFGRITDPDFCFIQPVAYLAEWNAIVMEELLASPLKKYLQFSTALKSRHHWRDFEMALNRAGRWLHVFHQQLGEPQDELFLAKDGQAEVDQLLGRLGRATNQVNIERLRKAFTRILGAIQPTKIVVSACHGDFHCGNILLTSDGRVGALDTNRQKRSPIYSDLGTLITDLETCRPQMLSGGLFIRPSVLEQCKALILRGYFADRAFEKSLLNFYCALAVLRKWMTNEEKITAKHTQNFAVQLFVPLMRNYFWYVLECYLEMLPLAGRPA
jgi:hypothetical protein